jgi:hypothetical protein
LNEIKFTLMNIIFDEKYLSKSKLFRIEVALRDSNGTVSDALYRAIGEPNYRFNHTFESLIYPLEYSSKLS